MISLTDKYVIAYGFQTLKDPAKRRLYIISRCPHLHGKNVDVIHEELQQEALREGYSNTFEYIMDIRFCAINDILETTAKVAFSQGIEVKEEVEVRDIIMPSTGFVVEIIEPQEIVQPQTFNIENMNLPNRGKPSRRIWLRMTENEQKFEEKINEIDDKYYFSDSKCSTPDESKRTVNNHVELMQPIDLVEQICNVVRKVIALKKAHEKTDWQKEIKMMTELLQTYLKANFDACSFAELNAFMVENIDDILPVCVLRIMIVIQKILFEIEDLKIRRDLNEIKCRYAALSDVYRRM